MEKSTTCAFTGHRDAKLPWRGDETDERCLRMKQMIYDAVQAVYEGGIRHYICGMALGCDQYFCEAVMRLREEHEDVSLEAAVPWEGQADKWSPSQKKRYERLVSECDYLTVVQAEYSPDCMMRRNRYMVDSAGVLIAAYNGKPGGTMNTLLYAMRQGVEVIQLPIEE